MKRKNNTTGTTPRRRYDAEFKTSALQMIQNGQSVPVVSRALGVGENLLHRWRRLAKQQVETRGQSDEVERLQRQVKQLEMERDILKKALSIFSRMN
jgi:transposase